ncbi:4a-hydroxytetrahydrobiopterin dehydratase [Candidatus Curtissbacteria bacterium]|nr:4a-hydroxytetrahydrobiopterin dehydratase [Candidatus Curtissbacteria bacterium]
MNLAHQKCVPCEGGTKPMATGEIEPYLEEVKDWKVVNQNGADTISREFKFKDFKEALAFVNKIGEIAEEEGHHPDIKLGWGRVKVELSTHAIGGLSTNDFILAAKINKLQQEQERSEAK